MATVRALKLKGKPTYVALHINHARELTPQAIAMIHESSFGSLRDIDRIATGCLRFAARRNARDRRKR